MEEEPILILILIYAWFDLSGTDCFTRKLGWEQKRRLICYTKMRLARAIACAASASRLMSPSPTWSVSPTWPAHLRIHTSAHHRRAWEFLHLPTSGEPTISFIFHATAAFGTRHCPMSCTPWHLQQPVVIHYHHHHHHIGHLLLLQVIWHQRWLHPNRIRTISPNQNQILVLGIFQEEREREREQWIMARYWCCACSRIWPATFSYSTPPPSVN